ncbi:thiol-disulfide oxidoreductase DCC family protein [Schlesneria paludicola]|uniref:thiol-disulfide oxidoreductase DCC family protein n=1 Tax=Schlesneria paludicola TaxID=360056 RepID=UPI00029AC667|nr:DUF393 domain-containing protein [Schlesneria paludicola]
MTNALTVPCEIEVFFDGGCPLCLREVNLLRRMDRKGKIQFTDIDNPDFRPEELGKTYDDLMAEIQGRLSDGTWVTGVEVFRRLYTAVGFGPLVAITRLPILSQTMNLGYRIFARNRLRLTGRCRANTCDVRSSKRKV